MNAAIPSARAGGAGRTSATSILFSLLLPLALLHGLLYLALVPPWQHYDEPTHFEYARLIALWGRPPAVGEFDLATRREIADSMYRFRFWEPGVRPALFGPEPPNIGFDEKVHPPLYYALAAAPVRALLALGVEPQLYAARLIGVALYVLVIACAWRIATILAPDRPILHLVVPLVVLLVPAFADQMSAVNNDSLVNASMTALMLGCVLLIRDGVRPLPLGLVALSLAVGILAKRTAVIGILPACLALFWSLRRRPLRWWVAPLALVSLCALVAVLALQYESGTWSARPWLVDLNQQYLRLWLNDPALPGGSEADLFQNYAQLLDVLFTSFWVRLGWGQISLGVGWDWAVRVVVLAGVVGLAAAALRSGGEQAPWRRRVIWLFLTTVLLAWIAAVLRFDPQQSEYIPRGRYMHPAIVPTIWLLSRGFQGLMPRRWQAYGLSALVLFFVVLDVAAWAGVLSLAYYR